MSLVVDCALKQPNAVPQAANSAATSLPARRIQGVRVGWIVVARRPLLWLLSFAIFLLTMLAHPAAAEGEAVSGTLKNADGPVPGVEIVVRDEDGSEIERVSTDDDGAWRVELPGPGDFQIELVTETLPEGVSLRDPDKNPFTSTVREGRDPPVNFALGDAIVAPGALDRLPQQAVNGLKFGLIIAITAVGLSLVFGTTGLINFAHGEFVTLGAVVAWFVNSRAGLPLVVGGLIAAVAGALFGVLLEAGVFARLRRRKVAGFQFLVITIGLSLFMQSVLRLTFGSGRRPFEDFRSTSIVKLGPAAIPLRDVVIMIICVIVLVAVALLLQRTRVGKAMRAVSDNRELAEASGINVGRVVLFVWALGSGLAAFGGVLQGLVSSVEYLLGFKLLLLMFAAIILGGLGTAFGAIIGGIVVGLVSEISTIWFPNEVKSAWALLVLIAVLLVRPQGILGRRERVG